MYIIGHHTVRKNLQKAGKQPQSFLFVGPRSVGKSLCALEYASSLVGEPDFEPNSNKPHPYDVMILRPSEETKRGVTKIKNIPAEAVREALVFLSQFPASGKFRVLIIEDAHRLSETAQNVLLKTLEEPPSSAVILLVTHEVGTLLPTVLSRVRRVSFGFVPEDTLHRDCESQYSVEELSAIAPFFFALGRPGMIISALENPAAFAREREFLGSLFRLSTLSLSERLQLAEKLALHTDQLIRLLEWWLPGIYQQAIKISERKMTIKFFSLLNETEETLRLLKTTQSNTRLLLEKLFLAI